LVSFVTELTQIIESMDNKATSWIEFGIKILAETGKIELNTICKENGKSKSSFYSIYPNDEKSKGLERFEKDLLKRHEEVLRDFFDQTRSVFEVYDISEVIERFIENLEEYYFYHCCSAHVRRISVVDDEMKEYWLELQKEYLELISSLYKIYDLPQNPTLDEHELRLILDSLLTSTREEFSKDGKEIISMGMYLRRN